MNKIQPRIILNLDGVMLDAYMSAMNEFVECSKPAQFPGKNQRLNNETLKCILNGLERATKNDIKYPNKRSAEYHRLLDLISYMKREYQKQRGYEIDL